jgi:DinB family protein
MIREQLLAKLDAAWTALTESYAGLPDSLLAEPGVVEDWSVKDILAHVTTWEEEALKYLPFIVERRTPPRYSVQYGGIDAFNALRTEQKRGLSLDEVLSGMEETHRRLIEYVRGVPEEQITRETPFRHRLRFDSYRHYLTHAQAIREWREERERRTA